MLANLSRRARRVIVGVHGTPGSVQALRHAASEARLRRAVLTVVNVWSPIGGEVAERMTPCPELCRVQQEHARQDVEEACRQAQFGDDLTVEKRIVRGAPGEVLTHIAQQKGDLLVVGAPRRSLFAPRYATVIRYCLRNSHLPVMIVPAPARQREAHNGFLRRSAEFLRVSSRRFS
ncbi:universal stress protein [Streptomyces sp. NBC_01454]